MEYFLDAFNRTDTEDPLKNFRFGVEIGGFVRSLFSKVSGLSAGQTEAVEYREGGMNTNVQSSPGLTKNTDVTLERGLIVGVAGSGETNMLDWYKSVYDVSQRVPKSSKDFRRTVDIITFDKEGVVVVRWRLLQAWPKEYVPMTDLDAMASGNLMERLVLVHEGMNRIL